MNVWVVTRDEHSQEGLEGAFDVYEGVFDSALGALASIETWASREYPTRYDFDLEAGRVEQYVTRPRVQWVNGVQYPAPGYESRDYAWTIREVEL